MTEFQEQKRIIAIEHLHNVKYAVANMMDIHYRDYENNPEYDIICRQLKDIEMRINAIGAYL